MSPPTLILIALDSINRGRHAEPELANDVYGSNTCANRNRLRSMLIVHIDRKVVRCFVERECTYLQPKYRNHKINHVFTERSALWFIAPETN